MRKRLSWLIDGKMRVLTIEKIAFNIREMG